MTSAAPGRRARWARGAWQAVAFLLIFVAIRAYTQRGTASGLAPPLVGRDLDGGRVSLADVRGQAVLVQFWATWCPVCNAEGSTVDALARDHTVITVATSSGQAQEIRSEMEKRGVRFPVVVDAEGDIARRWGVKAFPTSFFVSPEGRISTVETGFTSSPGFRARLWLAGR